MTTEPQQNFIYMTRRSPTPGKTETMVQQEPKFDGAWWAKENYKASKLHILEQAMERAKFDGDNCPGVYFFRYRETNTVGSWASTLKVEARLLSFAKAEAVKHLTSEGCLLGATIEILKITRKDFEDV